MYKELPVNEAYRLLNHGPLVWVSTLSGSGHCNIAPVAWCCPFDMQPTQVLLVLDSGHLTSKNLKETAGFALSLPHISQVEWVRQTGSVSGKDKNKFEIFSIPFIETPNMKIRVPEKVIGFMECRVEESIDRHGTTLVIGRCLHAAVLKGLYEDRLLVELAEAKTLHHLGGKRFAYPSDQILS